jgi:SNF2 family DNA or RNA helicase
LQPFQRAQALDPGLQLHPHQQEGIHWLQICRKVQDRKGVLLADDMGLGKTLQILAFLSWAIESNSFPDLSRNEPPYRPILIVVPLILLENKTWETEMERFFTGSGSVFRPTLQLHGKVLDSFRYRGSGAETEIGRPILDLNGLQQHRVVMTNYETVRNYQHSFAYPTAAFLRTFISSSRPAASSCPSFPSAARIFLCLYRSSCSAIPSGGPPGESLQKRSIS